MDNTTIADMTFKDLIGWLCPNYTTGEELVECLREQHIPVEPLVSQLSKLAMTILIVSYITVFILALIGNSLVVIVITRRRSMRTVINMFILSLASSDLLVVLFCVPFTLVEVITVDWVLGAFLCKALNYISMVAIVSSTLTLLAIAMERHHAICYPLRVRLIKNPRQAGYLVAVIWIVSMCLVSPLLVVQEITIVPHKLNDVIEVIQENKLCQEQWGNEKQRQHFTLFLVIVLYVIPLTTMIALYMRIANQLWVRKVVAPGDLPRSKGSSACSLRYKKRATKMLITVVVLFAVCWLPYHIVSVFRDFTKLVDNESNRLMLAIVQLIGFSNSFNNPIVYVFLNENFKRNFLRTLTFNRRRKMMKANKAKKTTTATTGLCPYQTATTL